MAWRPLTLAIVATLTLAGCVTPGASIDPASLALALPPIAIDGAELVEQTSTSATFLWKDTIGARSRAPGLPAVLVLPQLFVPRPAAVGDPARTLSFTPPLGVPFQVSAAVQGESAELLHVEILGNGTRQCTASKIGGPAWAPSCTTRIYDPLDEPEDWLLVVRAGSNDGDVPFELLARIESVALPASPAPPQLVAHDSTGSRPVPPEFQALRFTLADTGVAAAEPTIGVASDGTIFTTGLAARLNPTVPGVGTPSIRNLPVARSQDQGATWEMVSHPVLSPKLSFDPWLWLDPLTDRLYDAPLYVECSWAQWTDDLGATWEANPTAGCGLPDHDHQKLTTGPPAAGVTTIGYPNVVYYSYNPFRGVPERAGTYVTASLDGGRTWSVGSETIARDCTGGISGGVAVAPDGTAYSSHGSCEGVLVAVSRDSGTTWSAPVRAGSHHLQFSNPDMGFDRDGVAYLAHSDEKLGVALSISRDGGASWEPELDAMPPALRRAVFPVLAVGEPGKVAISYLATTADPSAWPRGGDPSYAPDATVWHSYVTYSHNALDADPTWITVRVTPDDDPVQIGCIWLHGGGHECRNLLDFIDSTQHEGRVYTVRADGCDACAKASRPQVRGNSVVEIQVDGPTLGPAWWAERQTSSAFPMLVEGGLASRLARP